jgi:hypothetical protein
VKHKLNIWTTKDTIGTGKAFDMLFDKRSEAASIIEKSHRLFLFVCSSEQYGERSCTALVEAGFAAPWQRCSLFLSVISEYLVLHYSSKFSD